MLNDIARRGMVFDAVEPLIDGQVCEILRREERRDGCLWHLPDGAVVRLTITQGDVTRLQVALENSALNPLSLGLRVGISGVRSYLRNGYQSWDGSFFVAPGTPTGDGPPGKAPTLGFAMTALLPVGDRGALVIGFERHDRYQSRFRFGGTPDRMTIDIETLLDQTGAMESEVLLIFDGDEVEATLQDWSRKVAAASPLPPRVPTRRITGWCSWYSLYASIDPEILREHLHAAAHFRDQRDVPLDVFLIDDGFTPEMGDWLEVKPQFAQGMQPLVAEIAEAGFRPGLWIAPFMVGNRSKLHAQHPDWVVRDRLTGGPLVQMQFYGEFRWHKRSEEYYILDVTHPEAKAYIREVFRIWHRVWGVRYVKTDFMLFGAEHGPDRAVWHRPGLSRIAIWREMAALIREEIGEESLWLGCGCPLWASVGYVDAMRIGRDIGVSWNGEYSAESLLRDQLTRNHAAGILWQSDPDCILLRDRFHALTDEQVRSLAHFAGFAGGVLMTSDKLDDLSEPRARMFADLLRGTVTGCRFPRLGMEDRVIAQSVLGPDGEQAVNLFNTSPTALDDNDYGVTLSPFQSCVLRS